MKLYQRILIGLLIIILLLGGAFVLHNMLQPTGKSISLVLPKAPSESTPTPTINPFPIIYCRDEKYIHIPGVI